MIVLEWLTALLLLIGAILVLLAAIGVLRFPDTFLRMQASSKASTLGLACLLGGTALQFPEVEVIVRLGSIAAFVMLTSPLSAHVVARVALHRGTPLWQGTVLNEYEPSACDPQRDPTAPKATAEGIAPLVLTRHANDEPAPDP
jgi:multicomponent Na+:H+ antiporter subunit G